MSKIIDLNESNRKKKIHKTIVYVIFIIIILYIFYTIYLVSKNSTDAYMIETGEVISDESAIGYIIRDEQIVKGENYKNGIYSIVAEGERAAKDQAIFRYYGTNEEQIKQNITEIDDKIQKALEKQNNIFPTDIKNIEKQIDKRIHLLESQTDIQKLNEYKKEISELLTKKARIIGESSPTGSYIKELTNQREELENQLLKSSEYIKAPKSGVVSYRVDNLENVLTINNFSEIEEETLNKLDLKTGKIVSTNNECAKIIDNFGCYIVTFLDSNDSKDAEEGKNVTLTLSGGNELQAKVDYVQSKDENKTMVIFKLDTLTEEMISYRKISFNITWWKSKGLKVQNSSIVEDSDGLKYVIRKKSGNYTKVLIKVLKKNEKYAIISEYKSDELKKLGFETSKNTKISIYDTILMYPDLNRLKLDD